MRTWSWPRFLEATMVLASLLLVAQDVAAQSSAPVDPQQPPIKPYIPGEPARQPTDPWEIVGITAIDFDVRAGFEGRLDDPPRYASTAAGGLMFGIGVDAFLSQRLSVGLAYEHIDLPSEDSGLTPIGTVRVTRDLNSSWLRLRLYPLRTDDVGTYLAVGAALSWQSAQINGSVWPRLRPDQAQALSCEGAASMSFALRGEAGVDVSVGGETRMQLGATLAGYRLTDSVLGTCVPGAGSASMMSLRIAVVYGLEGL